MPIRSATKNWLLIEAPPPPTRPVYVIFREKVCVCPSGTTIQSLTENGTSVLAVKSLVCAPAVRGGHTQEDVFRTRRLGVF